MCEHEQSLGSKEPNTAAVQPPVCGSKRRRLWELPTESHCSLVGVCMPIGNLRQIVAKTLGGKLVADDYELHSGVVSECETRNRISECLQRALEQRHANAVRKFRSAKSRDAVLMLWREAVDDGDISGAFWAALTHAWCDESLERLLCRELHMLQHQAGAHARADLRRMSELIDENAALGHELARVQQRSTRLLCDKVTRIEQLEAELIRVRAQLSAAETDRDEARTALDTLRATIPDLETRERLHKRIAQLQTCLDTRDEQLAALRQQSVQRPAAVARANRIDAVDTTDPVPSAPQPSCLAHKKVLCVGGRNSSIASYRNIIESYGGDYVHHDGGMEESIARLVASIAAADLIICQTGCISHDAYWRVKDQCKRTGKQCIYVENPSPSSLARSLWQALAAEVE